MHEQAKQPRHLGDQIVGWTCIPCLLAYVVWHFARWAGA